MTRHRRGRRRGIKLDVTTLLAGLMAGILPACILVIVSYFYLSGLNPAILTAVQEPQLARVRARVQRLDTTLDERLLRLRQDLNGRAFGFTDAAVDRADGRSASEPDWDLVTEIRWYIGELRAPQNDLVALLSQGRERSGERVLSELEGTPEERRRKLRESDLKHLPVVDVDMIGFSYPLESLLYTGEAVRDATLRQILLEADLIDVASIRAFAELQPDGFRMASLPAPIRIVDDSAPVLPGDSESESTPGDGGDRLLTAVNNPGGGTLAIVVPLEPLLRRSFERLEEEQPSPAGLRFRLERVGTSPEAIDETDRLWARWPLSDPLEKEWELWVETRGDDPAFLINLLSRLGPLHYLWGGLLLLALMTVASLLLTGFLSRRVRESRQKDDFVRLVSHELRTPIASVRMIAETLSLNRVRDEEERTVFLNQLEVESLRLTDLIERVLEYGKSAGEREVVTDPVEVVEAAVQRYREQFRGGGEVELRVAQEFHPVLLDREAVTGVVYNLLTNARKYSPSDLPIEVTVGEESKNLFIEVRDYGPGIRRRDQKRIFRPFFRGNGSASTPGFGLGLAYCREVVQAHGGRIMVKSSASDGSRFVIEIPQLRSVKKGADSSGGEHG